MQVRVAGRTVRVRYAWGVELRNFPSARSMAYTTRTPKGLVIVLHPRMKKASRGRFAGVIWHELGHVVLWDRKNHSEDEADVAGSKLAGRRIRYDQHTVQSLDPRSKYSRRPRWLPQH